MQQSHCMRPSKTTYYVPTCFRHCFPSLSVERGKRDGGLDSRPVIKATFSRFLLNRISISVRSVENDGKSRTTWPSGVVA